MNKSQIHDLAKRIFKISIAVTIIAYLFYLMHWPFQKGLSLIADLSLVISFITIYSFTSEKTIFHHIGLGASILILLNILYPYLGLGLNPLVNYKNIAILSLIGPEIFSMFSGKNPQKEKPNDTTIKS